MTETAASSIDRDSLRLDLKQRLLSFAREIGFDSCRVADCGSAPHADEFRNWLDEGGHGEMSYMERGEEKRCDPQKVLPGARSIVVLALNYFQGKPQAGETPAAAGRIARYAWGDDYHDLIANKLDKIDEFLREFGGATEMLCRYRAGFGTRSRGAGRHRLAWQEHDANRRTTWNLVFSRRNFDDSRTAGG